MKKKIFINSSLIIQKRKKKKSISNGIKLFVTWILQAFYCTKRTCKQWLFNAWLWVVGTSAWQHNIGWVIHFDPPKSYRRTKRTLFLYQSEARPNHVSCKRTRVSRSAHTPSYKYHKQCTNTSITAKRSKKIYKSRKKKRSKPTKIYDLLEYQRKKWHLITRVTEPVKPGAELRY